MGVNDPPVQGGLGKAGSAARESLWLGDGAPSTRADVEARVWSLWPSEGEGLGRDKGQGGRLFRLHGAGPSFSTARLQKFALALAGNLRYHTVEIFLSRPVVGSDRSTPVMVAAAFRKDASSFSRVDKRRDALDGRERHPWRWQSVYDLSAPRLEPLRSLLLSGERARSILARMDAYVAGQDYDLVGFVNYVAAATAVAMLARSGVSDTEDHAPFLWKLLSECLSVKYGKGTRGFPSNKVRDSLQRLTTMHRNLLLEDPDSLAALVKDLGGGSGMDEAATLWKEISNLEQAVLPRLRPIVKARDLPSSVAKLLFEAPARSYPLWLRSATLSVEEEEVPILHGDLHLEVEERRHRRNKVVNYLTLEAYERAAQWILFPSPGDSDRGLLRSMLLFPFRVQGHGGLVVRGFVRLMNRFSGAGDTQRPFEYHRTGGAWEPCSDETSLGIAVTSLLRERVLELGIMPSEARLVGVGSIGGGEQTTSRKEGPETAGTATVIATSMEDVLGLLGKMLNGEAWQTPERWRTLGLIGTSPSVIQLRDSIERCAADRNATVHLFGQTGVGKEVVARCVHKLSARSSAPFVPVSITEFPETLLESELFGHERGAFTGAVARREGRFATAHQGTLFLDEVSEIPWRLQVKLLRVLQEREVTRVGANLATRFDVRVVSGTNKSLEDAVAARPPSFREDLFYRLSVVKIVIPTLRERMADLVELVAWILTTKHHVTITPTAKFLRALEAYDWRGNIRELENALHRAVVMAAGEQLDVSHLSEEFNKVPAESVRTPKGIFADAGPTASKGE